MIKCKKVICNKNECLVEERWREGGKTKQTIKHQQRSWPGNAPGRFSGAG